MNAVYLKQAQKDKIQLHVNFSNTVRTPAHLQCVHNNHAKFEECQPKNVRGLHKVAKLTMCQT
jgi:hypothetical protein